MIEQPAINKLYSHVFLFVIPQESSESANTTIEDEDVRGRQVQTNEYKLSVSTTPPTHLIKTLLNVLLC